MIDIVNLALPYFGPIFIGFACGRSKGLPEAGLAWMNFLSALCFAARAAVWNHVENAVRGTQQPANRFAQRKHVKQTTLADSPRRPPRRREARAHGQTPKRCDRADQM